MQPLQKSVWRVLKKLKLELLHDPEILLLGTYPDKAVLQEGTCTPVFTRALFTTAKTWGQPNVH